jgi:hypothetical protein
MNIHIDDAIHPFPTATNINESIDYGRLTEAELLELAKSKVQRRLFAMALTYKRGKLPAKYASDNVKKLASSLSEEKLREFAKTNEKKRRADGSVGKRDNIPQRVKKKK